MEEWKPVKGYEGLYEVSNLGRVKSLNYRRTGKERILKGRKNNWGYLQVILYKDDKRKNYKIHRLVAQAFLPNPDNLPEVNHKDEDKTNNCVDNLEYCNNYYNVNYGTRNERAGKKLKGRKQSEIHIKKRTKKLRKPVYSISIENGLITYWESIMEASRQTGIDYSNISKCCKGNYGSAGNHYWFYAE